MAVISSARSGCCREVALESFDVQHPAFNIDVIGRQGADFRNPVAVPEAERHKATVALSVPAARHGRVDQLFHLAGVRCRRSDFAGFGIFPILSKAPPAGMCRKPASNGQVFSTFYNVSPFVESFVTDGHSAAVCTCGTVVGRSVPNRGEKAPEAGSKSTPIGTFGQSRRARFGTELHILFHSCRLAAVPSIASTNSDVAKPAIMPPRAPTHPPSNESPKTFPPYEPMKVAPSAQMAPVIAPRIAPPFPSRLKERTGSRSILTV